MTPLDKASRLKTPWRSFKSGFQAGWPIIMGLIPFALIYGASAKLLGLTWFQTAGMSLSIFAGSSQLVFLDLWGAATAWPVLVLTGLVINLRMVMYSASISEYLGPLRPGQAFCGAYFLTDEAYGISLGHFWAHRPFPHNPFYFYLGAAMPTWLSWQSGGLAGYAAGGILPENWPLEMAVPLVFLALLVPMVAKGPKLSAALAAGATAILSARLPMNLGLILAVFVGVATGLAHEKLKRMKAADK